MATIFGQNYFTNLLTEEIEAGEIFVDILITVYFTMAVAVWATTIGKRLFGLYVIRTDGSKVGLGRALVRYVMYSVSAIILLVGFITIGLRSDKRGLHDLICDTRVVKR